MQTNKHPNILILDDNKQILESLSLFLGRHFEHVHTLKNPNEIYSFLFHKSIDVLLLDMNFSAGKQTGNEGIFWLKEIGKKYPNIVIILITAYGDIDLAVEGMKNGAFDFILKPWDNKKLLASINAAVKYSKSRQRVELLKQSNEAIQLNTLPLEKCIWQFALRFTSKIISSYTE